MGVRALLCSVHDKNAEWIWGVLAELEAAHDGRVKFAKLDIDENLQTASRYSVLSIPTAILFQGGEARETVIGARPRSYYEQAWAEWLT